MAAKEVRPVVFNKPGKQEDLKDFGPKPVPYEGELIVGITDEIAIEADPKEEEEEVVQEEIAPAKKIAIAKEKKEKTEQVEAG